jgi:hypothetical protein
MPLNESCARKAEIFKERFLNPLGSWGDDDERLPQCHKYRIPCKLWGSVRGGPCEIRRVTRRTCVAQLQT